MNKKQLTFDTIAEHLLTQDAKSIDTNINLTMCRYRCEDGRMCAVGVLIPDEKYNDDLEGSTVEDMNVWDAIGEEYSDDTEFLMKFQYIHDQCNVEDWAHYLCDLADDWDLDASVVHKFTEEQPE